MKELGNLTAKESRATYCVARLYPLQHRHTFARARSTSRRRAAAQDKYIKESVKIYSSPRSTTDSGAREGGVEILETYMIMILSGRSEGRFKTRNVKSLLS
jgi:hypothetical protein